MTRTLALALAALTLAACGPSEPYDVPSGDFYVWSVDDPDEDFPTTDDLADLVFTVDVDNLELSFGTPDMDNWQTFDLELAPEEDWTEGCPTMSSIAITHTYTLGEDMDLAGTLIEDPMLSALCGGRPMIWSGTDPDGEYGANVLVLGALDEVLES